MPRLLKKEKIEPASGDVGAMSQTTLAGSENAQIKSEKKEPPIKNENKSRRRRKRRRKGKASRDKKNAGAEGKEVVKMEDKKQPKTSKGSRVKRNAEAEGKQVGFKMEDKKQPKPRRKRKLRDRRGRKPLNCFFFFARGLHACKRQELNEPGTVIHNRAGVWADNPTAKRPTICKILGAMWRALPDDEKEPYIDMAVKDRQRYAEEQAAAAEPVSDSIKEEPK